MADVNIDLELITKQFDQSLNKSLRTVQSFADRTDRNFDRINKSIGDVGRSSRQLGSNLSRSFLTASSALGSFAGTLGAGVLTSAFSNLTDSIVGFGSSALEAAQNVENLEVQFTTLTGSGQTAQKLLGDLQQFAASTPFQLEGLARTSAQLISFGFEADNVLPKLRSIGDVAAATGSSVQDIGLIFGQISAAGRLTGERLLQLQERGIPILQALVDQGVAPTQAAVRELVTQGEIDFKIFEDAFNSLSEEGGIAFEGMIKRSQTFGGVVSTLRDNFTLFSANIGKAFLPALKLAAIQLTQFIQSINTQSIINFIQTGIRGLIIGLQSIIENINPVLTGFRLFGNIVALIGNSTVQTFNVIRLNWQAVISAFADGLNRLASFLPEDLLPDSWKQGLETFKESTEEVFEDTLKETNDSSKKIIQNLTDIRDSFNDTVTPGTINKINSLLEQFKNTVATQTKNANQLQVDSEKEKNDKLKKLREENKQNAIDQKKLEQEGIKLAEEEFKVFQQEQEIADRERKNLSTEEDFKFLRDNKIKELEVIRNAEIEKANSIQNRVAREQAILNAHKNYKSSLRKFDLEQDRKKQKQQEANTKSSLSAIGTLQQNSAGELFEIGKAANIANAIMNGYGAVSNALNTPYPLNVILPPLVAASAAAQVARISAARPPSFQDGGIVPGNSIVGDNVTARVNSGEMILNRNQQAELFNQANGGGSSNNQDMSMVVEAIQNMNITLVANDNEIARSASRGVVNGIVIGESE